VKFLTKISHECSTPLPLVLACVDDIISGQKMPSKDANLIKKNAIRLLRLVNQLMDFRKIDNNKMVVHPSHNDFVAFTREIMGSFDRMAIQKKIDYRLIAKEGIIYAYFDENMLDKVLFNLLSNAFKFTEEGGRIHVLIDQLIDNENVILRIEDNGLGMTKDQVKHAFDRFFQAKTHMVKGTGLGLSLSKEIIELHKGKIYVESEKGRGTRFTIILPLNHPELVRSANIELPINIANKSSYSEYLIDLDETATVEKGPISIDPPIVVVEPLSKSNTILIIEDNDDLRKFMAEKLNAKYYVIQADNGIKGLNLALERLPDLIISDIMLPEMDGIEILERVKSDRRTANIPTIILTANDRQEQKVEGLEKGADAYVIKPFNLKRLFATIEQLLNRSSDESNPLSDNPIEEKF
ncbi:MAG: ATP-binding protein, partial [Bacteroidota bacterium]